MWKLRVFCEALRCGAEQVCPVHVVGVAGHWTEETEEEENGPLPHHPAGG